MWKPTPRFKLAAKLGAVQREEPVITAQHSLSGSPLIAMPPLTPSALRIAVAQLAPARVAQFGDHLERAVEQSLAQETLSPLHCFVQYWGEFVAIERVPERAARLHRLEQEAQRAPDRAAATRAIGEIQQILAEAEREVAEQGRDAV